MSVGHISRGLEEAGIPTVAIVIRAFRARAEAMRLPRVVVTRNLLGRTISAPGDVETQRRVLLAALNLLQEAKSGPALVEVQGSRWSASKLEMP